MPENISLCCPALFQGFRFRGLWEAALLLNVCDIPNLREIVGEVINEASMARTDWGRLMLEG